MASVGLLALGYLGGARKVAKFPENPDLGVAPPKNRLVDRTPEAV